MKEWLKVAPCGCLPKQDEDPHRTYPATSPSPGNLTPQRQVLDPWNLIRSKHNEAHQSEKLWICFVYILPDQVLSRAQDKPPVLRHANMKDFYGTKASLTPWFYEFLQFDFPTPAPGLQWTGTRRCNPKNVVSNHSLPIPLQKIKQQIHIILSNHLFKFYLLFLYICKSC